MPRQQSEKAINLNFVRMVRMTKCALIADPMEENSFSEIFTLSARDTNVLRLIFKTTVK